MKYFLGIELGSTRIKAVLTGEDFLPAASGSYTWENRFEGGYWTYRLEDVWTGLRECLSDLAKAGAPTADIGAVGISAMMHGYLPFDRDCKQLVPFRTWRNTTAERAAGILTERLGVKIPGRWSAAHLYQAILDGEPHVGDIAHLTTLAGYVHYMLTGENVLGVGEASGMFPVCGDSLDFDPAVLEGFDALAAGFPWRVRDILPRVLSAGEAAGTLTEEGARLLGGVLPPGIPFCPPEGDAGTGMVATNSVGARTGNVSAGTSIFAMAVLDNPPARVYPEIDVITTPAGRPVAMVHGNNCTPDIDAWAGLFGDTLARFGAKLTKPELYDALYASALEAQPDGGGLTAYNFFSGETAVAVEHGRPMLVRLPDSRFTLPNLMRTLIFSSMGILKLGLDILTSCEGIRLTQLQGHGGLFKTREVGQRLMASALGVPVSVMENAGEGGAWGISLLAAYSRLRRAGETLEDFCAKRVFADAKVTTVRPDVRDSEGFASFMRRYKAGLDAQRAAVAIKGE